MTLRIVMGPTNQGASFRESPRSGISFVESHVFWPTKYVGAGMHLWLTPPHECLDRGESHLLLAGEQGGLASSTRRVTSWRRLRCWLLMVYSAYSN